MREEYTQVAIRRCRRTRFHYFSPYVTLRFAAFDREKRGRRYAAAAAATLRRYDAAAATLITLMPRAAAAFDATPPRAFRHYWRAADRYFRRRCRFSPRACYFRAADATSL